MYNYPSRQEKRQSKFYQLAEDGVLEYAGAILYTSEIKNLRAKGFEVFDIREYSLEKKLYTATISREHAFGNSVPYLVYAYTHLLIETFLASCISGSFPKELYVIAKRIQLYKLK